MLFRIWNRLRSFTVLPAGSALAVPHLESFAEFHSPARRERTRFSVHRSLFPCRLLIVHFPREQPEIDEGEHSYDDEQHDAACCRAANVIFAENLHVNVVD